ncbi:Unknown protein sequence [Pseudomonas coronafaciens pv. zizaniae]|nr:Unknown protein sequence [Pseudomonas coronafaciens pv. zizaniae]
MRLALEANSLGSSRNLAINVGINRDFSGVPVDYYEQSQNVPTHVLWMSLSVI